MSNKMIKTKSEIAVLREGGKILHEALQEVKKLALEGEFREVSSFELEKRAIEVVRQYGGEPSFLNYKLGKDKNGDILYPSALCVSVDEEIVHGIPTKDKIIRDGTLLKIDLGVWYKNLCTDAALTVAVGDVSEAAKKITQVTKEGLKRGLKEIKPGKTIGDYGYVVNKYVTNHNFFTVFNLVGHGVGYEVHEPPQIPNYGQRGDGVRFKEGMVLALEPMVAEFTGEIKQGNDGFAWVTADGGLAAHFEHTVVVTAGGCEVLT